MQNVKIFLALAFFGFFGGNAYADADDQPANKFKNRTQTGYENPQEGTCDDDDATAGEDISDYERGSRGEAAPKAYDKYGTEEEGYEFEKPKRTQKGGEQYQDESYEGGEPREQAVEDENGY